MSDSDSDPFVIFSEKLLGLRSECPACSEWENSTGRLLYREKDSFRWYVELKCPGCKTCGVTWKRDWMPLIEEVLEAAGRRVMTAAAKPCAACGGGGECNACGGTGVDVGVAVMGGTEADCERCGGMRICPVCGGSGEVIEEQAGIETR